MRTLITILLFISSVFAGSWTTQISVDDWSGDTSYIGMNIPSSSEIIFISSNGIMITTKYSLSSDIFSEIINKNIDVKTSKGDSFTLSGATKASITSSVLIVTSNNDKLIDALKTNEWVKLRIKDYDNNYKVITIDCSGFLETCDNIIMKNK